MNHAVRCLAAFALCLAVVACTKSVKPTSATGGDNAGTSGSNTGPGGNAGSYTPTDLDANACLRERVVYFDFDRDALRPESRSVVDCHAKYLRDRPSARIVLSGHADERGSRGYNVGLGERRGNAVLSALAATGASNGQINVVSYGEGAACAPTPPKNAGR